MFAATAPNPAATAIDAGLSVRTTPHQGRVALTFDDGPHPRWTEVVLDVLDEYGVKATFFVNGFRVKAYPEVAAEIVRRGHSLQNHTYGHNRLPPLSDAGILRDIVRGYSLTSGDTSDLLRVSEAELADIIVDAVRRNGSGTSRTARKAPEAGAPRGSRAS